MVKEEAMSFQRLFMLKKRMRLKRQSVVKPKFGIWNIFKHKGLILLQPTAQPDGGELLFFQSRFSGRRWLALALDGGRVQDKIL